MNPFLWLIWGLLALGIVWFFILGVALLRIALDEALKGRDE